MAQTREDLWLTLLACGGMAVAISAGLLGCGPDQPPRESKERAATIASTKQERPLTAAPTPAKSGASYPSGEYTGILLQKRLVNLTIENDGSFLIDITGKYGGAFLGHLEATANTSNEWIFHFEKQAPVGFRGCLVEGSMVRQLLDGSLAADCWDGDLGRHTLGFNRFK